MSKIFRPMVILWLTLVFSLPVLALDETKKGLCWEETRPADPVGCLAQIDKTIIRIKAEIEEEKVALNKKKLETEVKLLKVDHKRIKQQSKDKISVARKIEKREERELKAESYANISCLEPKNKDQVRILNVNHVLFNNQQAYFRLTVVNPYPSPVVISAEDAGITTSGSIVELPGGCEITLSRSIRALVETWNTSGIGYRYKARALNPSDYKGYAYSNPINLYSGNSFSYRGSGTWVISNFFALQY